MDILTRVKKLGYFQRTSAPQNTYLQSELSSRFEAITDEAERKYLGYENGAFTYPDDNARTKEALIIEKLNTIGSQLSFTIQQSGLEAAID